MKRKRQVRRGPAEGGLAAELGRLSAGFCSAPSVGLKASVCLRLGLEAAPVDVCAGPMASRMNKGERPRENGSTRGAVVPSSLIVEGPILGAPTHSGEWGDLNKVEDQEAEVPRNSLRNCLPCRAGFSQNDS